MTDGLHPEYEPLLRDLVARHGGLAAFSPVQREIAGQVVQLMLDMRSSQPGDLVRHAEVMNKLMAQLPPIVVPPAELPEWPYKLPEGASEHEAGLLYQKAISDIEQYAPDPGTPSLDDLLAEVRGESIELAEIIAKLRTAPISLRQRLAEALTTQAVPAPPLDLKASPPEPRPAPRLREVPTIAPVPKPSPGPSPEAGAAFQPEPTEPGEPSDPAPLHADPRFSFRALGGNILSGEGVT